MRIRITMDKLLRHVKGTFYCEECDRIDTIGRTSISVIYSSEVKDILNLIVRLIPLESFELKEM